jgi:MFS family permease
VTALSARMTTPKRSLAGLLLAHSGALTANRILLVALPWLVLTATGSPTWTGVIAGCHTVPFVLAQAVSGPLLDRAGARWASSLGDLTSAAALAVLVATDRPPLWLIAGVALVLGAADGPAAAAKTVLLPGVTTAAGQPLERGAGIATAVERAATAAGPALAALLIATHDVRTALLAAAALLSVAAVLGTVVPDRQRARPAPAESYPRRLRTGAAFLHTDTSLRAILAMVVVTNFVDQAFLAVLLPVWAREHGHGANLVGAAISTFAVAATGTALLAAWIGNRLPRRTTYLIGFTVSGVSRLVVLACQAPPGVVLLVFAVAGLGSGLVNPLITTLTYERVPAHLLGRVNTLITAFAWAGIPLGGIAGAALLTTTGLSTALWCCSAAYLTAVLRPGWRVQWQSPGPADHTGPDRSPLVLALPRQTRHRAPCGTATDHGRS